MTLSKFLFNQECIPVGPYSLVLCLPRGRGCGVGAWSDGRGVDDWSDWGGGGGDFCWGVMSVGMVTSIGVVTSVGMVTSGVCYIHPYQTRHLTPAPKSDQTPTPSPVTMWPIPWCVWCHLPPPVDRMTDTCEKHNLRLLSYAAVTRETKCKITGGSLQLPM